MNWQIVHNRNAALLGDPYGSFNCSWGRWPEGKNLVLVCSSAQFFVATVQRGSGLWVWSEVIPPARFEMHRSWRVGTGAPIIFSVVLTVYRSFLLSDLVADPNQIVTEANRTDWKTADNYISSSWGSFNHRLAFGKTQTFLTCLLVLCAPKGQGTDGGLSVGGMSEAETIIAFSSFKQCWDHDILYLNRNIRYLLHLSNT